MSRFLNKLVQEYASDKGDALVEEEIPLDALPARQQRAVQSVARAVSGTIGTVYAFGDLVRQGAVAEINGASRGVSKKMGSALRLSPDLIAALYNEQGNFTFVEVGRVAYGGVNE